MPKIYREGETVIEAAKERLREYYAGGDRVVVSISGGKDSTVVMELAIEVARETGRLPVECIMRDEEIMVPGTFEYLERVYQRPEVDLHWISPRQAIINMFNRFEPYWWVFDPAEEDKWVRQPPPWIEWIPEQSIGGMTTLTRFPPDEGKRLIAVIGLRAQESLTRMNRIVSTGGALTKHPTDWGAYNLAPIYDWTDEDVWKAMNDFQWDYNSCYNHLFRVGCPRNKLRIAPPTMTEQLYQVPYMAKLWPKWFERVNNRVGGMRLVAHFGRRAIQPSLKPGETWEDCYRRMMQEAVEHEAFWLVERMEKCRRMTLSSHAHHSPAPLPQTQKKGCTQCPPAKPGSWERMCKIMWNGDPYGTKAQMLAPLEPYELRPGAKGWFEENKKSALSF